MYVCAYLKILKVPMLKLYCWEKMVKHMHAENMTPEFKIFLKYMYSGTFKQNHLWQVNIFTPNLTIFYFYSKKKCKGEMFGEQIDLGVNPDF